MRASLLALCLVLFASCTQEKLPELYLLQGACEVQIKTDDKKSDIYVDGILIGHGEASTQIPCSGQKKISVEAAGKWTVEEYKEVSSRMPLELEYKLKTREPVQDWAMSAELIAQLKKGQGALQAATPEEAQKLAEQRAKKREEQGYSYTAQELAAAAKKSFGSDDRADAAAEIKIDPNTNFDDPKTWL